MLVLTSRQSVNSFDVRAEFNIMHVTFANVDGIAQTRMTIADRLHSLGIKLPDLPSPKGMYVPAVLHNGTLYLSGQGPLLADGTLAKGVVGQDVSVEDAKFHARRTGMVLLAAAQSVLGSLDRVERIVSVLGMVNAAPGFMEHPKVINGCSEFFIEVFGEAGHHARAAVGMGTLPENISVEITAVFAVKP
jgi:enamine deaminase RidA (YjgF/YER057c/UK114 family)